MNYFLKSILIFSFLLFTFLSSQSFAQTNDAIGMILSAKTFTITEEYIGDWGGYTYTYTFIKNDKNIHVVWEEINSNKAINKGEATISFSDLKAIEDLFDTCVVKIKKGKQGSTEHSKYIFKDEITTYQIDDNSSMICVDDIKAWRTAVFNTNK